MSVLAQYTFEPVNVTLSGLTVTAVEDQSVNNYDLANAGAPQYEAVSWTGLPAIVFDGVDDTLKNTGALANAMIGGADTPCQIYMVAQLLNIPPGGTAGQLWSCGDNASVNPMFRAVYNLNVMTLEFRKRDAATAAGAGAGGNGGPLDRQIHVFKWLHDGTTFGTYVDNNLVLSGAMNVGTMGTMDNFAIACLSRTTDSAFANIRVWAMSIHDTLTAGEEAALDSLYDSTYIPRAGLAGGDHFRRRI